MKADPLLKPYNIRMRQVLIKKEAIPGRYKLTFRLLYITDINLLEDWLAHELNNPLFLDGPAMPLLKWQESISRQRMERTYTGCLNTRPAWMVHICRPTDSGACTSLGIMTEGDYTARLLLSPLIPVWSSKFYDIMQFTISAVFRFKQLN